MRASERLKDRYGDFEELSCSVVVSFVDLSCADMLETTSEMGLGDIVVAVGTDCSLILLNV